MSSLSLKFFEDWGFMMLRRWIAGVSTVLTILSSHTGFALFDAQALLGPSSMSLKGNASSFLTEDASLSGHQTGLVVHLDPIPLVPIGFGLGITIPATVKGDYTSSGTAVDVSFSGLLIDLQVMAWSPVSLFGLTPYGKLGYIVSGSYKVDFSTALLSGSMVYDSTGSIVALGVNYSLLPLIGVLFEFNLRNETIKLKELKGGLTGATGGTNTASSSNILLGLEVGI